MVRLSPAVRISIGLVLLTITVVLSVGVLGIFPDQTKSTLAARKQVCESLAVYGSLAVLRKDMTSLDAALEVLVQRNPDMLSAALRRSDNTILAEAGPHQMLWRGRTDDHSTSTEVQVPIFHGEQRWGTIEVVCRPVFEPGVARLRSHPLLMLVLWITPMLLIGFYWFMRRTLRYLDPNSVIPGRVKTALDTLVEGVVLLDNNERIVLANSAFADQIGESAGALLGRKASELGWQEEIDGVYPWQDALRTGSRSSGVQMSLDNGKSAARTFVVNGAAITDQTGQTRGVMATFDDVTQLERQNDELQGMLALLESSRDEVREQNERLQILAREDPLTRCLNRRSFFETFEAIFEQERQLRKTVSCILADIDHFKSINDTHGHMVGDQVLKGVAGVIRSVVDSDHSICRYGGEEFLLLLPDTGPAGALNQGERLRLAVEAATFSGISVTISIGASSSDFGAERPHELLQQADTALYAAKAAGRNRVVIWDEDGVPDTSLSATALDALPTEPAAVEEYIPHAVVNALMVSLAQRDPATAAHSRHVADLCVALGRHLMPLHDCFVVEIAALLHDIGKLGVPDSVLLKCGPLTEAEWVLMRDHDRRSVEVIASTLLSPEVTEIVRNSHSWYSGTPHDEFLPVGDEIPLGARILTIADAFSAMVLKRPYRSTRGFQEAFEELRRCSGRQFDPRLVEKFIEVVNSRDETRTNDGGGPPTAVKLLIGREIEKLLQAVNMANQEAAGSAAARLRHAAAQQGLKRVAELAAAIETAAPQESLMTIVKLTNTLMTACRQERVLQLAATTAAPTERETEDEVAGAPAA